MDMWCSHTMYLHKSEYYFVLWTQLFNQEMTNLYVVKGWFVGDVIQQEKSWKKQSKRCHVESCGIKKQQLSLTLMH